MTVNKDKLISSINHDTKVHCCTSFHHSSVLSTISTSEKLPSCLHNEAACLRNEAGVANDQDDDNSDNDFRSSKRTKRGSRGNDDGNMMTRDQGAHLATMAANHREASTNISSLTGALTQMIAPVTTHSTPGRTLGGMELLSQYQEVASKKSAFEGSDQKEDPTLVDFYASLEKSARIDLEGFTARSDDSPP